MKTKTTLSITQARKNIFDIAEKVQQEENYFTLTERGVPKVVILSAQRFETILEERTIGSRLADGNLNKYSCSAAPHIVAKTLIIRDESRVVYLSQNDQDSRYQEESLAKAQLYVQLIEKYKYPLGLVEFGRYVKVGAKEGRRYIESDLIVNDERGNVRMVFEVGTFADFENNSDRAVADLFEVANSVSWVKKPEWVVYFSRACRKSDPAEKILAIDCRKFNTFYAWKKAGRPAEKKIPLFK